MLPAGTEIRVADLTARGAPPLQIPIVFEDQWLLVVDKPGIPTQGTWPDRHDLLALIKTQRPG